ncbi:MAG: protein phosphatase 2C domain-containing protein [Microcoleus sp.]
MDNSQAKLELTFAGKTDCGKVRPHNEDNYLLESWPETSTVLAVVADGMGGHRGGEVAAQIAVDTFRELLKTPLPETSQERYELLLKCFYDADEAIQEAACENYKLFGMGTTIIAAIVSPTEYIHLYAGDCRLYHFAKGNKTYITADHSVVQVLLELGRITEEDIPTHPMRSVVNSCLGGKENHQFSVDPKWGNENLPVVRQWSAGDVLLLCSDGLNGEVSKQELTSLVEEFGDSPERLTEECVNKALEQGGNDNITVIAIVNFGR